MSNYALALERYCSENVSRDRHPISPGTRLVQVLMLLTSAKGCALLQSNIGRVCVIILSIHKPVSANSNSADVLLAISGAALSALPTFTLRKCCAVDE